METILTFNLRMSLGFYKRFGRLDKGFFTRDDLERLSFQRKQRQELSTSLIDTTIVNRPYQIEAIRRVLETFSKNRRKGLLVMVIGTGKTRVAMALIMSSCAPIGWNAFCSSPAATRCSGRHQV